MKRFEDQENEISAKFVQILGQWTSGREDEESLWEQSPILDHYRKPSNAGSFSKQRKPKPILPVVNPVVSTRNHGFSAIQEISSPSSDSSWDSSLGATYVPPSDLEWQRNYSKIEIESPPPDSVLQRDNWQWTSGREDEESLWEMYPILDHHRKPSNGCSFSKPRKPKLILPVVNPVVSTRNHGFSAIQEISSPSSDSSWDSSPGATYVPPSDLEWQRNYSEIEIESPPPDLVLQRDYSNSENEVYPNAAWPVFSAIWTESVEDEDSNYIKQLDVIIDVPTSNWSLTHKNEKNQLGRRQCLVAEGKWIKHYNSYHRILLVGEGDFSFSVRLAVAFGSASNMIATSLDSVDFLKKNYKRAMWNIEKLRSRKCIVMHGIDATEVASHHLLEGITFDRIVFNFPYAGFFKDLSREAQLRKHRGLVSLFLKNAKEMIGENGEIHISHKTNGFHGEWELESVASSHGLRLIEAVEFNQFDYEGYDTKCGFGGDNNFNCYPSKTYKFGL